MKRAIAPTNFAIAFAIVFTIVPVLRIVPRAQAGERKECSNATLCGNFGYTATGTLLASAVSAQLAGPFGENR